MKVARLSAMTEQQVCMKDLTGAHEHHVEDHYSSRTLVTSDGAHLDERHGAQYLKEALVPDIVGFITRTFRGLHEKGEVEGPRIPNVGIPTILVILRDLFQGTRVEVDRKFFLRN